MSKTVIQKGIAACDLELDASIIGETSDYRKGIEFGIGIIKDYLQSLLPEEKKQMEPNAEMKALLETIVSIRAGMSEYYRQHNYRELYAMYNQLDEQAQQLLNKLNT